MALEEEFGVELESGDGVTTVRQLIDAMLAAVNRVTRPPATLRLVAKKPDA
jgi:hypothetical protein